MEAVRVVSCESYYDLREIIQYRLHNFPTQCIILDENGKSPNTEKREALATKLPRELRSTTGHTQTGTMTVIMNILNYPSLAYTHLYICT